MLKVTIEEYVEKNSIGFYMPVLPWKWTIYDGTKIRSYGYTHTKEQAEAVASQALRSYGL